MPQATYTMRFYTMRFEVTITRADSHFLSQEGRSISPWLATASHPESRLYIGFGAHLSDHRPSVSEVLKKMQWLEIPDEEVI